MSTVAASATDHASTQPEPAERWLAGRRRVLALVLGAAVLAGGGYWLGRNAGDVTSWEPALARVASPANPEGVQCFSGLPSGSDTCGLVLAPQGTRLGLGDSVTLVRLGEFGVNGEEGQDVLTVRGEVFLVQPTGLRLGRLIDK